MKYKNVLQMLEIRWKSRPNFFFFLVLSSFPQYIYYLFSRIRTILPFYRKKRVRDSGIFCALNLLLTASSLSNKCHLLLLISSKNSLNKFLQHFLWSLFYRVNWNELDIKSQKQLFMFYIYGVHIEWRLPPITISKSRSDFLS